MVSLSPLEDFLMLEMSCEMEQEIMLEDFYYLDSILDIEEGEF